MTELDDIAITTIDGRETTVGELRAGRVALIVNVASQCGLTPQYEQLEQLQREYGDEAFTVIGVPSNQFLQERKSEDEIAGYCSATWGVTFPMTAKVKVNGKDAHPLYKTLKQAADADEKAGRVKWNFEKFLIGRSSEVVARFRPTTKPNAPEVIAAIHDELARA